MAQRHVQPRKSIDAAEREGTGRQERQELAFMQQLGPVLPLERTRSPAKLVDAPHLSLASS